MTETQTPEMLQISRIVQSKMFQKSVKPTPAQMRLPLEKARLSAHSSPAQIETDMRSYKKDTRKNHCRSVVGWHANCGDSVGAPTGCFLCICMARSLSLHCSLQTPRSASKSCIASLCFAKDQVTARRERFVLVEFSVDWRMPLVYQSP